MKKILVVDNNESILEVMETILTQNGFQVMIAYSYKTILPIIYYDKPDVIILDIMLSNEDGRLICQQLKESHQTKDICIILFSASSNKLKDFKHFGADGFLEKPFDLQDLIKVIKSCEKLKVKSN